MKSLERLAGALPKAELHVHLEGTLEPEMVFFLAKKHGVNLRFPNASALRKAYQFQDLQSFLDLYYEGAGVLRDREDFHQLTLAYMDRVARDGVWHVEPFFDPQTHTARGVAMREVVEGVLSGLREGEKKHGITWRLIPCFLRHLSEDDARQTWKELLPFREHFSAIGLDSSEKGNPPSKFTRVFEEVRAAGAADRGPRRGGGACFLDSRGVGEAARGSNRPWGTVRGGSRAGSGTGQEENPSDHVSLIECPALCLSKTIGSSFEKTFGCRGQCDRQLG